MEKSTLYARIYGVVDRIPAGKVATYGQVATLAGMPGHARQVGYALHNLPAGSGVPWQRVINGKGRISLRSDPSAAHRQRILLEAEGVRFDRQGAIASEKYRWRRGATPYRPRGARSGDRPSSRTRGRPRDPADSDLANPCGSSGERAGRKDREHDGWETRSPPATTR